MTKTVVIKFDKSPFSFDEAKMIMSDFVDIGYESVLISNDAEVGVNFLNQPFVVNITMGYINYLYNFNPVSEKVFFEKLRDVALL